MPIIKSSEKEGSALSTGLVITGGANTKSRKVDISFVIDTTGSMNDKIEALLRMCSEFVSSPKRYNLDPTFLLVSFGDLKIHGDKIETVVPRTSDITLMRYGLSNIPRNAGGGNGGESSFEAIRHSLRESGGRDAVQVMILITDEPAHQDSITELNIDHDLKRNEVILFVLSPDLGYFRNLAQTNGGEWELISANSSLDSLKRLFKKMAEKLSSITDEVYRLAGGDVQKYLRLKSGK